MTDHKFHVARTIERFFNSRVDIIIPFHGQYARVVSLVESIFRSTYSNVYHIYLVDDGSHNSEFIKEMKGVDGVTTIKTANQLGFGGACRVGFQASEERRQQARAANRAEHPYVVFMNSDCVIEDVNWLRALGMTLLNLKSAGVRMVAPKTNNPLNGDPNQFGKKGEFGEDYVLEKGHLSMYCFMCHRDLFSHVGFLKEYPYGWYEDEEFAYRMNHHGFKQGVSGASWVRHVGEGTYRELWRRDPNLMKIMSEDNRKRCVDDMIALQGTRSLDG